MRNFGSFIGFMLIGSFLTPATGFGAGSSEPAKKTEFSSAYTDLAKDCRAPQPAGEDEGDMPLSCKGYGDFTLTISYSAYGTYVVIRDAKDDQFELTLPEQSDKETMRRKLEWRFADGKPFAVIYRVMKYSKEGYTPEPGKYMAKKYQLGEVLTVTGLKGFEKIRSELPAGQKDKNVNQKAQELADKSFFEK